MKNICLSIFFIGLSLAPKLALAVEVEPQVICSLGYNKFNSHEQIVEHSEGDTFLIQAGQNSENQIKDFKFSAEIVKFTTCNESDPNCKNIYGFETHIAKGKMRVSSETFIPFKRLHLDLRDDLEMVYAICDVYLK